MSRVHGSIARARERTGNPEPAGPGERLELGTLMESVRISLQDLGAAVGISKTAMFSIVANNDWPKTRDQAQLQEDITKVMLERGLDPELVPVLFWAHRGRGKPGITKTDLYGRHPDEARKPWATPPAKPRVAPPTDSRKATDMLLAKQSLSYEASKAFQLFTNPFDGEVTRSEELFQNGELRFVREAMWQAGKNGRFVAVVGESGAGKTTLLADLEERIGRDREPVTMIAPRSVISMTETDSQGRTLKVSDIIVAIIMQIDPHATIPVGHEARTAKMLRLVEDNAKVGNGHLLVIEEAHRLSVPTLQALKRLHENCRVGRRPALGILLLGQPELGSKLNERRADLREVVQRCEVVRLPPLGSDLKGYLAHRAKLAGKDLAELITDDGLAAFSERLTVQGIDRKAAPVSLLYPLAINNLMTAALNAAAEIGAPLVDRDVVRAV